MYIYIFICICVCIYIYVYKYMYVYIYIWHFRICSLTWQVSSMVKGTTVFSLGDAVVSAVLSAVFSLGDVLWAS